MAVTLKTLAGQDIPADRRRPGLEQLYQVTGYDGEVLFYESDVEAAQAVVDFSNQDRERSD